MARYRTLRELYYPTDTAILRRLARGENVPWLKRHNTRVAAGEIVADIPAKSIPVLLAKGWIEEVPEEVRDREEK